MARFRGIISVDIPEGVTREDMASYIIDAIGTMKGSYRPPGGYGAEDRGDPLSCIDPSTIKLQCVINGETIVYVDG